MDFKEFMEQEDYRGMAYHIFFSFDNEGKPDFGLTPDRELDETAISELDGFFKEHFDATHKLDEQAASMGDTDDYSEISEAYRKVDIDLYVKAGGVVERLVLRRFGSEVHQMKLNSLRKRCRI